MTKVEVEVATMPEMRVSRIEIWEGLKTGKGIVEFEADTLLAILCRNNNLTIAVGDTGIPNDASFMTYAFPGEMAGFLTTDPRRVRILFTAPSILPGDIQYFCPVFDLSEDVEAE